MGAKNSRLHCPGDGEGGPQQSDSSSGPRQTPFIEAPYGGPWAEYQFVDVIVPVEADVSFSFCDVPMASTNSSCVLSKLSAVYSQGYSLMTFCRVPASTGSGQKRVFCPGKEVHYQGIFCRYEGDPGNEGWNLRAEKSLLHAHHVTPGVVGKETGPGAQHVQQVISNTVQTGGRLLTVQWSGQPQQSSTESALGVDVFFEVPVQALPERSVYQLVTAPATVVKRSLFASRGHITCDWTGILSRHLARGWRLVDIFCEVPSTGMSSALSPANAKVQTVWFFEKPESRARDDSAVYEGTIVEQWVNVRSSSSSSPSSLISGSAAGCLGGGRGAVKKEEGVTAKKSFGKRMASLRKKASDDAQGGGDDGKSADDHKQGVCEQKGSSSSCVRLENNPTSSQTEAQSAEEQSENHFSGDPYHTVPGQPQEFVETAGWEGVIRSMGEKGWELACIVNTMDSQVLSGKSKVKVMLVFQRRISLAMNVKGRRTSDGLAIRADTGASTSGMCDIPMMTGETASHLNPSLAVRLPLSRSASREHDDLNASCDDIPSTIGGSCSRTHSTTELSVTGRVIESGFLEPGRGSRRGREDGGFLQPKCSTGDEGSIGTAERSSPSSQHSKVTAVEVHTPSGRESSAKKTQVRELTERLAKAAASCSKNEAVGLSSGRTSNLGQLCEQTEISKPEETGGNHSSEAVQGTQSEPNHGGCPPSSKAEEGREPNLTCEGQNRAALSADADVEFSCTSKTPDE